MIVLLLACTGIDPTVVKLDDPAETDAPAVETDAESDASETDAADPPDPPVDTEPLDCGALDVCYDACVDLSSDPENCGVCGRTCVLPGASAACVAGECAVDVCEVGLADCDGSPLSGCETPDTCLPGARCTTTCGSTGAVDCGDACAPVCATPPESCNALDDDCDGQCDEGTACRQGIHRAYRGDNGHLFTRDLAEAQAYGLEAANFFYLYPAPAADLRPFFRCALGTQHFYTVSNDCEGTGGPVDTLGFIAPPTGGASTCGSTPLHRLVHPTLGWHFYTISAPERDSAVAGGWISEGEAGAVWLTP